MKKILILIFFSAFVLHSCKDKSEPKQDPEESTCAIDNPVDKGERMLGIDLLDVTETGTFDDNIAKAKELGVEFIALHLPWTSIETSANTYSDPGNAIQILSQYAEANSFKFSLTIRPIDITGKTVPTDLESLRFNDSLVIARFNSLTDFVFTRLSTSVLLNYQIGNEIDGYNTSSEASSFWEDYGFFLLAATSHIHDIDADVKVGFTGTHSGMMENPTRFKTLATNVDGIGVTYYPLKGDFSIEEPNHVESEITSFMNTFNNTTVYFQEIGCQSSETCGSSEDKQAEFFCNVFKVWDAYADQIKSMNIVRLVDVSADAAVQTGIDYGITAETFTEYIRSLGIQTYGEKGTAKKAYTVIRENTEARNW